MASTVQILTKDAWTLVLQNVTDKGQVFILDLEDEPTSYLVAVVPTGDPAPDIGFEGGIKFSESFSPANVEASDYYVKPLNYNGKVVILT